MSGRRRNTMFQQKANHVFVIDSDAPLFEATSITRQKLHRDLVKTDSHFVKAAPGAIHLNNPLDFSFSDPPLYSFFYFVFMSLLRNDLSKTITTLMMSLSHLSFFSVLAQTSQGLVRRICINWLLVDVSITHLSKSRHNTRG